MASANETWQAPGPGLWEMDEAHQSAPYSAYLTEHFKTHFNAGVGEACARYGALVDHFDIASVGGWQFARPRIVGAPEKPGPLPPRWLFWLLFRAHPALRRRSSAARKAVTRLQWRTDAEWWLEQGRTSMLARLRALQAADIAALDDGQLAAHLADVENALADGWRIHFRNAIAHWIGVGDWLAAASSWTGVAPEEALLALTGSSPSSVATLDHLGRIATAAAAAPEALAALNGDGDPQQRLQSLRSASPAVASALDAYLDEYGWRIYTGFDIADKATIEVPESILESVAALLQRPGGEPPEGQLASQLRAEVPGEHLAAYDALFDTARVTYSVRDDDVGPCFHWTSGLARRVLLEIGARLAQRSRIEAREHIFEAAPSEVRDLIEGSPGAVSAAQLTHRSEKRRADARVRPPARLGQDEGPEPPDEWLPPAVARVNRALMTAMSVEYPAAADGHGEPEAVSVLTGLAASRGVYEGRACVVQSPDDFAKLQPGDILVAPFTTTAYNCVLPLIRGVVTDKGGVLSHAAIVAREYAIPAVVNTEQATSLIKDGDRVRIDGAAGAVEVQSPARVAGGAGVADP